MRSFVLELASAWGGGRAAPRSFWVEGPDPLPAIDSVAANGREVEFGVHLQVFLTFEGQ
jgi:hypothetical protein